MTVYLVISLPKWLYIHHIYRWFQPTLPVCTAETRKLLTLGHCHMMLQPLSSNEKMPAYGMGTGGRFSTYKTIWKPEYNVPAAQDCK
jgi:hypothetical protein